MTVTAAPASGALAPEIRAGIARRSAQIAAFMIGQGAILFIGAGRVSWAWAWTYLAICVLSIALNASIMLRKSPELIAERGRPGGPTQKWDKVIAGLWALFVYLVLPLVAALDFRWLWTGAIGTSWHLAGAIVLIAGIALADWAILSNAYFSTAVRIQTDRGQTVCRTGPYRLVRHPGYVGFSLQTLATPAILGSIWALVPAAIGVLLMIVRTAREDRLLHAKLPGYAEYARDVRVRLVPGIW